MGHGLRISRRFIQGGVLLAIILLPLLGILRIDVAHGRFLLIGYQIWWSDFFVVYPFWIMVITFMACLYTAFGMVFCGWGCPQNTLSEFADKLLKGLIGKKAASGVAELESGVVTHHPDKKKNWVSLILIFLGVSLLLGFVGSAYFLPPGTSWTPSALPGWVWIVMFLIASIVFLDLILIRHFWCKYVCPYGLYQYLFHHPRTLRVSFDEHRRGDCVGCNHCTDSCFMGVEPRLIQVYTRCINCGDCIVACHDVAEKKNFKPLLGFTFQRDTESHTEIGGAVGGRLFWPAAIFTTAALLFSYGVYSYQPVHLRVSTALETGQTPSPDSEQKTDPNLVNTETEILPGDYLVEISNKSPRVQQWALSVSGLPRDAAMFSKAQVTLSGGMSEKVVLRIQHGGSQMHPETPYPFEVTVRSTDASGIVLSEPTVFYLLAREG